MKLLFKIAACIGNTAAACLAFSVCAFAEGEAATTTTAAAPPELTTGAMLLQLVPFAAALVLLYFIMVRPQQKREKEAQAMREAIKIGDEVCTAGGIVGIVLKVEEETVVLETGAERNRIRIKKWAIHENITLTEAKRQAEKERKAARMNGIATAAANNDTKKKKSDD